MTSTVIGVFDNATEAQQAVNKLMTAGFSKANVDLSARSGAAGDQYQSTNGTMTDTSNADSGIGGFFGSLFGTDSDDTRNYSRVADQGSVVTVHAQSEAEAEQAADMLDEAGAIDVNERAAQYDHTGANTAAAAMTTTGDNQTLKVIEENLEVGKRTVETGGVRVRSRIVSKPVEEHVRLREERVSIQRNPVNRPATAADLTAFQEGQIEMTERAEVAVVSKTANVVEEIAIGKQVNERDEVIRDTVRKTEVDVDNLGTTDHARPDADDVTYATK